MRFRFTKSIAPSTNSEAPLEEQYVQDAFHTFLQASLSQERAKGLLDVEVLSSAQGDVMIKGVSLSFVLLVVLNRTRARAVPLLGSTGLHDQSSLGSSPPRQQRCKVVPAPNALAHQLSLYIRAPHEPLVRVRAHDSTSRA